MQKVLGIGGLFFRSRDPESLARWYRDHLGIDAAPAGGDAVWRQMAGPTVFATFKTDTDYFGNGDKEWMVNFRVADLDGMVTQLRDAGIDVEVDPNVDYGRFARLYDPEGNPIELWQEPDRAAGPTAAA